MPVKPSDKEEEYFNKLDLERRKKINDEKLKLSMEEEKIKLKELHYMRCPKCGMELREINYKGINVDNCVSCDGVWFDAGEIDNLLKLEKPAINKLFSVFKK
ncbi:MAG: zf-TFIIB domain-containing protein [Ignavibacteriales bacterium]|nr:zf-TFIIB domain-containing protein [Ignavibacteriales bacterium]